MKNTEPHNLFRAHIDKVSKREQSVKDHLVSVSEISAQKGKPMGLENTCRLLGLLHDKGKFTIRFDQYLFHSVFKTEKTRRGEVNHSSAGAKYIFDTYENTNDFITKLTAQLFSVVISSHHGLYDCLDLKSGENKFQGRVNPPNDIGYEEALENFFLEVSSKNNVDTLFQKSVAEISAFEKNLPRETLPFQLSLLTRFLLSLLIEGDWTDTSAFVENIPINDSNTPDWSAITGFYENKIAVFRADGTINVLRKQISEDCRLAAKRPGGIYQLIVPTGGGKTLASLRFSLHHILEHENKKRIFYIIPFLSILEQNALVLRGFVGNSEIVLEHHSNLVTDIDEKKEDPDAHKFFFQGWEEPIVITTMVQFLNTLFSDKLQSIRRMHALSNSVIILDEIQSLPLKTANLFNSAMNFLASCCGATVVLCSATQPELHNKNTFKSKAIHLSPNPSLTQNLEENFRAFKRVKVEDLTHLRTFSTEDAAVFCSEKIKENDKDKLLFICNTKKQAAETFKHLEEICKNQNVLLFHLSTNMAPAHRAYILKQVKELLHSPQKMICVSTQLIEAGVDVDFFCVVRVVAGLDNVIQAAGRCNRNALREMGFLYIIRMSEENLSQMREMKEAQKTCLDLLEIFDKSPEQFDDDLFSIKSIRAFYNRFYSTFQNTSLFDYPLPKQKNTTIFNLLSKNDAGMDVYRSDNNNSSLKPPQIFCQGFKTAGEAFEVISNNTTDILVPYQEGASIITELNSSQSPQKIKRLLRKAQQYTVSVYDHFYRQLIKEDAIYPICGGKISALKPNFYDENTGIRTQGGDMDFLMT